jgi:hypothetical protein
MSKRTPEDDGVDDEVDWNSVYPATRIKAQVMNDDRVGRLSNKAAEYIGKRTLGRCVVDTAGSYKSFLTVSCIVGACSALFVQKLASEAKNSLDGSVVMVEDVRRAAKKHDFLEGALDDVTEQSAPKRPRKKKPKLDTAVKDTTVQEAIVVSAATAVATYRPEITVDEEDYD